LSRYRPQDRFFHRAKQEKYAARSIYKLEEIDRRHHLFSKGDRVVDLGAAPGSWLQYVADAVGKKGCVVGYDIEPVTVGAPNAESFVADVAELDAERVLRDVAVLMARIKDKDPPEGPLPPSFLASGVISDMAPKLTGIRDADQAKSVALARHALVLAAAVVKPEGYFVAKLFQGRDTDELVKEVKEHFKDVKLLKPEATREGSREVFLIALAKRIVLA
jgi:23S rRNA (uridine2552-2'-O)-methyltransferase